MTSFAELLRVTSMELYNVIVVESGNQLCVLAQNWPAPRTKFAVVGREWPISATRGELRRRPP